MTDIAGPHTVQLKSSLVLSGLRVTTLEIMANMRSGLGVKLKMEE